MQGKLYGCFMISIPGTIQIKKKISRPGTMSGEPDCRGFGIYDLGYVW